MNRVLLFFVLLCVLPLNGITKVKSLPRLTRQYLMEQKWYLDVYEDEDLDTSVMTFTLTEQIDSVFTEEGDLNVYVCKYYLSDSKDLFFDTNKVGKTMEGKYLILERATETEDNLTFILEVVSMSDEKMVLKHLTEGYTTYGYTTVFYTAPFS